MAEAQTLKLDIVVKKWQNQKILFGILIYALCRLCGSRKYPYPPTEGFSSLTPTPVDFPFQRVWPYSPPPPGNSTILPLDPLPLGKSISTKQKRDLGYLYLFYHHLSKVSKCAVQVDENVFRGTVFTGTLS